MEEKGNGDTSPKSHNWTVGDKCVLKLGSDWVRGIIEEITASNERCKVGVYNI